MTNQVPQVYAAISLLGCWNPSIGHPLSQTTPGSIPVYFFPYWEILTLETITALSDLTGIG